MSRLNARFSAVDRLLQSDGQLIPLPTHTHWTRSLANRKSSRRDNEPANIFYGDGDDDDDDDVSRADDGLTKMIS